MGRNLTMAVYLYTISSEVCQMGKKGCAIAA